jgi:hypothetical protein
MLLARDAGRDEDLHVVEVRRQRDLGRVGAPLPALQQRRCRQCGGGPCGDGNTARRDRATAMRRGRRRDTAGCPPGLASSVGERDSGPCRATSLHWPALCSCAPTPPDNADAAIVYDKAVLATDLLSLFRHAGSLVPGSIQPGMFLHRASIAGIHSSDADSLAMARSFMAFTVFHVPAKSIDSSSSRVRLNSMMALAAETPSASSGSCMTTSSRNATIQSYSSTHHSLGRDIRTWRAASMMRILASFEGNPLHDSSSQFGQLKVPGRVGSVKSSA